MQQTFYHLLHTNFNFIFKKKSLCYSKYLHDVITSHCSLIHSVGGIGLSLFLHGRNIDMSVHILKLISC